MKRISRIVSIRTLVVSWLGGVTAILACFAASATPLIVMEEGAEGLPTTLTASGFPGSSGTVGCSVSGDAEGRSIACDFFGSSATPAAENFQIVLYDDVGHTQFSDRFIFNTIPSGGSIVHSGTSIFSDLDSVVGFDTCSAGFTSCLLVTEHDGPNVFTLHTISFGDVLVSLTSEAPLPATPWLLGLGLAALGWRRRSRVI
jgi:hypothetical protein